MDAREARRAEAKRHKGEQKREQEWEQKREQKGEQAIRNQLQSDSVFQNDWQRNNILFCIIKYIVLQIVRFLIVKNYQLEKQNGQPKNKRHKKPLQE